MKQVIREIVLTIVVLMTFTTVFVGCKPKDETLDIPIVSSSVTSEVVEQDNGFKIVDAGKNSNFKKYWAENEDIKTSSTASIIAAREGAKV
ncbi:MAG: hypothetical protein RSC43_01205, partial [Clostridia bacterium]